MDTIAKGEIAVLEVQRRALDKGWIASKPLREGTRYDLILDDGGKLYRVQVKYADGLKDGVVRIVLTKQSAGCKRIRLYCENEIDAILAYLPKIDKVVWFGPDVFSNKGCIFARFEPAKNGQTKGLLLANDYIW